MAFSPDGRTLAAIATNGRVIVWEVATGDQVHSLTTDSGGNTYAVAYSPNGQFLATGGGHRIVKLWDSKNGNQLSTLEPEQEEIKALALSTDSGLLASRTSLGITIWNMANNTKQTMIEDFRIDSGRLQIRTIPPNSRLLGIDRSRRITVWDSHTGAVTASFPAGLRFRINDIAISSDSSVAIIGGRDTTIDLGHPSFAAIDMSTGNCWARRNMREVFAIAVSADGKLMATGGRDGKLQVWDFKRFLGRE